MDPRLIVPSALVAGAAAMTAYGAVYPGAQLFGPAISHTGEAKKLALTFDDGPNPAITPKLLELLAKHKAHATFFLVGKFVRQCPVLVKEVATQGHALGNHTETHPNLFFCGPAETHTELLRCTEAIQQATLEEPRWFRPPFGLRSPWLGALVQQHRMRMVMWTLIPGDWRIKPPEWLIERMKPIAAHAQNLPPKNTPPRNPAAGDVLCLHDGDYARPSADRTHTLAALEYWLPRWRDLGLEFVTIGQAQGKAVEG